MASDPLEGLKAELAGRYAIQQELGSGGMATVYLAEDLKHRRNVAIKIFRPEVATALGPVRFLREIKIAASLNHPHVLTLYDSGEAGGFLFYVMPQVSGESLRQRLEREKQLSINSALAITRQVASALDHAHSRGVIHRDIKPENILLHEREAMVADFGVAVAVSAAGGERLTSTGMVMGTSAYMSPEQAMGDRTLDARSDVYSLGCVLYEMLAGEPPYTGSSALAVFAKRLNDPVPGVRRLRDSVPASVERALIKALARVPADRYPSAGAFAEGLTATDGADARSPSVAVLPFLNLSADPENEYFADGITEDIIAQLSKIRALKVISRTSVMAFKRREQGLREIAAKLGVATLLEGSVRRAGDRVRIVAQLIDAETDRHLWAETYDRQLTDIFAIQSDVALQIGTALEAELSPEERTRIHREPTSDLQAYQLYLQGRHWFIRYTREGLRKSIEFFERAIERDPKYAVAYVGVALACGELAETGLRRPDEAYAQAKQALARALELDPELSEAHAMLAYFKYAYEFDWTGAEEEFNLALQLNPSGADTYDYYGRMLSGLERYDESVAMLKRARELDPVAHPADVATALVRAGRYDEAIEAITPAIELDSNYARSRATLGWAYLKKGMNEKGLAELEKAVIVAPAETTWLGQLGQAYALVGDAEKARHVLRRLEELSRQSYVSPYHLAYVYAGLGELETAMDLLERAYAERSGSVYGIKGSFLFAPLRSHPRFTELLKRMNLA